VAAGIPTRRAGPAFLFGYAVAYIGGFIGVAPLLQVLAPLHAELIGGEAKGPLLSQALFWGCMAAGVGNIIGGALSDRTRSRHGRRRPWIIIGAVLTIASYAGLHRASTPVGFVLALVGFQLAFNILLAPLLALFADRVPENRRSAMSAVMGMGYPLAAMIGSVVMAWGPQGEAARLAVLAAVVAAATVPFALLSREDPPVVAVNGSRVTRRKPLGVTGAVLLTIAAAVMAATPDWTLVLIAFALYGLGQGCYGAVDIALMTDVLPSAQDRGKDLGLINLAVTLPQAIAPLIALVLLERLDLGLRSLFVAAALCFLGAALAVAAIRRVR